MVVCTYYMFLQQNQESKVTTSCSTRKRTCDPVGHVGYFSRWMTHFLRKKKTAYFSFSVIDVKGPVYHRLFPFLSPPLPEPSLCSEKGGLDAKRCSNPLD